jgi:hypothetical protein
MDVLRFIWRNVRKKPERLRRLALFSVVATLALLACLVTLRVLAARNVPEVAPLLGTLDVVILLLSGTFLAQILVGAVHVEILRLQAISEDPPR